MTTAQVDELVTRIHRLWDEMNDRYYAFSTHAGTFDQMAPRHLVIAADEAECLQQEKPNLDPQTVTELDELMRCGRHARVTVSIEHRIRPEATTATIRPSADAAAAVLDRKA